MREAWAQPIVIDNRGGAGTAIGGHIVAKSPPDGYTLMFTSVSYTTNAAVQPKLPFDPLTDIAGIAMIGKAPMLLVVHPAVPAKSVKELIALARARPGQLNYASNGVGTLPHLLIEMLMRDASISMVHVPYKGLAGDDGPRRRTGARADREPAVGLSAGQGRAAARTRGQHREAIGLRAGVADDGGVRRARLHRGAMVGHVHACRNAERDHRVPERARSSGSSRPTT